EGRSRAPFRQKAEGRFLSERFRLGLQKGLLWTVSPPSQAKALKEQIAGQSRTMHARLLLMQHLLAHAARSSLLCNSCRQSYH
ncbi:MAG: hypothetical protein AAGL89_18855, partial [Pseudomonadota bacterium]